MPTVIIPPTDVSPNTGSGSEVLSTSPNLITPTISVGATTTAATDLLINPTVKASGNLIDLQVASSSKFSVSSAGNGTFGGSLTVSGTSALNGTVNTNGAKAVNVTPTMTPLSGNLYGLYVQPTINSGASAGGTVSGLTVAATNSGTSNVTNIAGIEFTGGNGAASGSMQDLKAFRSSPINLSTGQIVNLYQFYATNAYNPSGIINTQYGLYVDALTSATTNYAIYTAGTAPSVLGGNLTVSGTGLSSVAGALNVTGALLAHQTAALNMAHEGSSLSQLVSYGADASTYGRLNITLRKAGTGVGAVTALALTSTDATFGGNLTVSGTGGVDVNVANGTTAILKLTQGGYTSWNFQNLASNGGLFIGNGSGTALSMTSGGSAGTTTVSGNLTVSGTGGISIGSATFTGGRALTATTGTGNSVAIRLLQTVVADWEIKNEATTGALSFAQSTTNYARLTATGNFLIGTVVDSSGLLQVGTNTTTAAGGMKFGTDVSVYRSGTRELTFLGASSSTFVFAGTANGATIALKLGDGINNDQGIIESQTGALVFKRGPYTALTLDTSQNATFAGNVTVGNSAVDSGYTLRFTKAISGTFPRTDKIVFGSQEITNGSAAILGVQTAATGAAGYLEFKTTTSGASITALTLDSSQNATFAGKTYTAAGAAATPAISFSGDTDSGFYNPGGNQVSLACGGGQIWNTTVNGLSMASGKDIYLGNAYQAATVVPTGYVTIKDSTGTVYKVCVLL